MPTNASEEVLREAGIVTDRVQKLGNMLDASGLPADKYTAAALVEGAAAVACGVGVSKKVALQLFLDSWRGASQHRREQEGTPVQKPRPRRKRR